MTSQKPRSLWRAVLAVASVTALLACSLSPGARSASADTARKLRAGPFLGAPAAGTQPIWLCVEAAVERIEVAFAPDTQGATPNRVPAIPVEGGPGSFVATLTGLSPNTGYRYDVLIGGEKVPKGSGAFRTPPAAGTPFQGRIAVVSCSDVKRDAKQPAFKALAKEEPGLLLHLGDNVYANTPRRARQAALHIQQRRVKTYRDLVRATPVAAIWDDHDYGKNDGNGTLKGKQESLAVFREMFPNPGAEGVFSKLQYGDVDLFLLDTRYHRAPNFSLSRGKAMLGEAQMKWLEDQLAASTATF
ncbi:MAG: alkaline phosphatase D family protein, partial [Planctomycetota bacterium]